MIDADQVCEEQAWNRFEESRFWIHQHSRAEETRVSAIQSRDITKLILSISLFLLNFSIGNEIGLVYVTTGIMTSGVQVRIKQAEVDSSSSVDTDTSHPPPPLLSSSSTICTDVSWPSSALPF